MGKDFSEDATSLCISCGLCCNGTLFSSFELEKGESPQPGLKSLTRIDLGKDGYTYSQPCSAFACGNCSIYADRPSICRTYRCRTLFAVEQNELEMSVAQDYVRITHEALARVVELVGADRATAEARSFLVRGADNGQADLMPDLMLVIGVLEILLDRHFRWDSERVIRDDAGGLSMPKPDMG